MAAEADGDNGSVEQRIADLKSELCEIVLAQMEDMGPDLAFFDLKVLMTNRISDIALTVTNRDGSAPALAPDERLEPLFRELRGLQYIPGKGAWFSALVTNDREMRIMLKVNYDVDPMWYPPLSGSDFREDLEAYPRDEGYIPDWLAAIVIDTADSD
ncbi:hypothetical protein ACFVMC_22915 [Nocardia sp. NPDC127579]|uniref:hypothetical protein n=1 Tax=Nocardia sp. NPDC127579 TaxID=3345402 RepID=UPI0036365FF2